MQRYHISSATLGGPPNHILLDYPCVDRVDNHCEREHVWVISDQERDAFVDLAIDRGIDQLRR